MRMKSSAIWISLGCLAAAVVGIGINRLRRQRCVGKVVLITGGSRGLGLEMARVWGARGAKIAICSRNRVELDRAVKHLQKQDIEVYADVCDITQPKQVEQFVEDVAAHFGKIDILVNNAGVIQVGPWESMNNEDFQAALNVHFWGPLNMIRAALPHIPRDGGGRIVNISSVGGKISVPHLLPYCASKAALVSLSEGLRSELLTQNIRVLTVCPGMVRTGSTGKALFKGRHREEFTWFSILGSIPVASVCSAKAARMIVRVAQAGRPFLAISLPARIGIRFHGAFPNLSGSLLGWANRLLPAPGGIGTETRTGAESHSKFSPSLWTALSDRAAKHNNEVGAKMQ